MSKPRISFSEQLHQKLRKEEPRQWIHPQTLNLSWSWCTHIPQTFQRKSSTTWKQKTHCWDNQEHIILPTITTTKPQRIILRELVETIAPLFPTTMRGSEAQRERKRGETRVHDKSGEKRSQKCSEDKAHGQACINPWHGGRLCLYLVLEL
jgi:hypothetical protein